MDSITKSLDIAHGNEITVRGIVVINPGNPTGQVMSEKSMRSIISLCKKQNIYLIADEVYQENIFHNLSIFLSQTFDALKKNYLFFV